MEGLKKMGWGDVMSTRVLSASDFGCHILLFLRIHRLESWRLRRWAAGRQCRRKHDVSLRVRSG